MLDGKALFLDVANQDIQPEHYCEDVLRAKNAGWIDGYISPSLKQKLPSTRENESTIQGYDYFRPEDTISRIEFLKIVLLINVSESELKKHEREGCFKDIKSTWQKKYACYALDK